jgi:hypothetical protein
MSAQSLPYLTTGRVEIDHAFRIALGDLVGNICPHQSGVLQVPEAVVMSSL